MVASAAQLATRAFVKLLLAFASQYAVLLQLSRDSPDKEVLAAFRRVSKKEHPDKGGSKDAEQKLNAARDEHCASFCFLFRAWALGGHLATRWKLHRGATIVFPLIGMC